MAARIGQLVSKAKQVVDPMYKTVRTETVKQYETIMAQNAEYVVKDKEAADKLAKQLFYTKMSKIPAGLNHAHQEWTALKGRLANFTELPVPEMAQYLAFAAELYAWFSIGEILGRGGTITGYAV